MAIDYSQRPSGMSKREYAASILGGSKEDYDSSGNKKSASSSSSKSSKSSSTYKPTEYKYQNFVDTKGVYESFDKARSVYTDQLTALKPRYEELYKQLQESEAITAEKEQQQFGQESTQQKVNLAKRGVATDTSNQFYTTEAGKLEKQQNLQSRERALEYSGRRLDVSQAQSADERDLNTAIANVDLGKATTIESMISSAKQFVAGLNQTEKGREYQSKRDAVADAQWERTFALTQSKDAADRALELYKLSKSESSSNNDKYTSDLGAEISTALTGGYGTGSGIRENIISALTAKYKGKVSPETIKNDVFSQLGNGWESRITRKEADQKQPSAEAIKQSETAASGIRALQKVEELATFGNRLQAVIPGQPGAGEYVNNINEVIDAIARLRTGAALTKEEAEFYKKQVPELTDSSNTIKSKINNLRNFFNGIAQKNGANSNDPLGLGI